MESDSDSTATFTILHVSDLHFGPYYLPPVGEAMLALAGNLSPDYIVASGDFTQRAKLSEFEAARDFLDSLPNVPTVVTPGNHDVPLYRLWERITNPYANYREAINEELDTVTQGDRVSIVALDSTAPLRAITNGRIDPTQLDFAERSFAAAKPGALRVVVAHHHFAPAPDYERTEIMPGAKRSLDRFERMDVDLVLGGHLHRAYIGNSLDIYPGPDRKHGIIIAQSGTTTSRRGRAREHEKNSFNLITVSETDIRLTHWMFFSDLGTFAPVSEHLFPRRPLGHFNSWVVGATIAGDATRKLAT